MNNFFLDHELNRESLDELVNRLIEEKSVPGATVGILHNGQELTTSYGMTNIKNPLPVTDETLFQISSNTKTYTGTAVMQLIEMGKLDLDEKVRTYIPDFRVSDEKASAEATIRHLLTHTAGWEGDFFSDTGPGDDTLAAYVSNMAGLKQLTPPGTLYSYSNSGFSVAGRIIEILTGKSYQAAMKELLLNPLGLENTYFGTDDIATDRLAAGHSLAENGSIAVSPSFMFHSVYPAAGITCNINDLLRYANFHLGDGSVNDEIRLLSQESINLMQSPQVMIWRTRSVGISWEIDEIDGVRVLSHTGGNNGQVSLLVLVPDRDFTMAVLTNADHGVAVTREIHHWAFKQYLDLEIPVLEPLDSSEEELADYTGHYSRPYVDIDLVMQTGQLVGRQTNRWKGFSMKAPPSMLLTLCEKDRLLITDGPSKGVTIEIIRKPDGSIGWLRFGGRLHERQV